MRQQHQQKPRQKGRESLLASTIYNKVGGYGSGLYRKLMINDGDPSTYSGSTYLGPGPANPNGLFGVGPRERSQTITEQQYQTERANVQKRANAERAKRQGFRSVTEMMQSEHRQQQQYQAEQKRRREEAERERRESFKRSQEERERNRIAQEQENRRLGEERLRQRDAYLERQRIAEDERQRTAIERARQNTQRSWKEKKEREQTIKNREQTIKNSIFGRYSGNDLHRY